MRNRLLLIEVLALLVAGSARAQVISENNPIAATRFDSSLHVNLDSARRLPTGVYVIERARGEGPVVHSDRPLTLRFAAWSPNGAPLQTAAPPPHYVLGSGFFLDAVEQAVPGMRVGETRRLLIPPSLAYGPGGRAGAGTDSVLVTDVTVVSQP